MARHYMYAVEERQRGFEDGYDKGCMDRIDDDLRSSLDEEEESCGC